MKVKVNKNIVVEKSTIFKKWEQDFSHLYGVPEVNEFDLKFQANTIAEKVILENNETTNEYLNHSITFEEVEKLIKTFKPNKSCGFDGIPN